MTRPPVIARGISEPDGASDGAVMNIKDLNDSAEFEQQAGAGGVAFAAIAVFFGVIVIGLYGALCWLAYDSMKALDQPVQQQCILALLAAAFISSVIYITKKHTVNATR
jgi:hypothetical protein